MVVTKPKVGSSCSSNVQEVPCHYAQVPPHRDNAHILESLPALVTVYVVDFCLLPLHSGLQLTQFPCNLISQTIEERLVSEAPNPAFPQLDTIRQHFAVFAMQLQPSVSAGSILAIQLQAPDFLLICLAELDFSRRPQATTSSVSCLTFYVVKSSVQISV